MPLKWPKTGIFLIYTMIQGRWKTIDLMYLVFYLGIPSFTCLTSFGKNKKVGISSLKINIFLTIILEIKLHWQRGFIVKKFNTGWPGDWQKKNPWHFPDISLTQIIFSLTFFALFSIDNTYTSYILRYIL